MTGMPPSPIPDGDDSKRRARPTPRGGDGNSYRCPLCTRAFTARDALCDVWDDPKRNFGCPHCGSFFVRIDRPRTWLEHLAQAHWIIAAITAFAIMLREPEVGLQTLLACGWLGFAIWFAFFLDRTLPPRTQLVPVDPPTVH